MVFDSHLNTDFVPSAWPLHALFLYGRVRFSASPFFYPIIILEENLVCVCVCYGWCILSCYHWSFFPRSDVIIGIWFNLKCQHSYEPLLSKLANDMFCSNWLGLPKICFGSAWTPCHCEISILFDRINIPLCLLTSI